MCLPSTICSLNLLECLDHSGCSNCDILPKNLGNLKVLKKLYLIGTTIKEFPLSIEGLTALTFLTLKDCKNLMCLPSTICCFKLMECLDLSRCSNCDNLPENVGNLKGLKELHLSGTIIKEQPSSIGGLMALNLLTLKDCKNLMCLPSTICCFKLLEFSDLSGCTNCENLQENLGESQRSQVSLFEWNKYERATIINSRPDGPYISTLKDYMNLVCLPSTICSLKLLECLHLSKCSNCDNLLENLGNFKGLKMLFLSGTTIKELPSSIEGLTTVTFLILEDCKNLECLPSAICSLK